MKKVASQWDFSRALIRSRTIPTRCPYCGAKVFFYTNEYGSKVSFDELGPPWPIHSCPGYERAHKNSAGIMKGPVGRFIHAEAGELVHADTYFKNIQSGRIIKKQWDHPIIAVHPVKGSSLYEIGVVRDVILEVNIYKRFNLKKQTMFSRQLLGDIGEEKVAQVTMYANDITTGKLASYTFFILQARWHDLHAVREDLLHFEIEGKSILGKLYWMCKDIGYVM